MRISPLNSRLAKAFTLIELIVVITIIGIIAAFVIPAASTIIMGTDLTRSAQVLTTQLNMGRTIATTKNHAVEVRFIKYADPEIPGAISTDPKTWKYRAIQLMEIFPNGNMAQVGKFERMVGNVYMNDTVLSSLLDRDQKAEPTNALLRLWKANEKDRDDLPPLPRVKKEDAYQYQYIAFRFLPDGSTDLNPKGKWYVTVLQGVDEAKVPTEAKQPTFNYFTAQIDTANGTVRSFRPTAGSSTTGGTGVGTGK